MVLPSRFISRRLLGVGVRAERQVVVERLPDVFQPTVGTADAGKAVMQVAAIEEFGEDFGHDGPQRAVLALIASRVFSCELLAVLLDTLPQC